VGDSIYAVVGSGVRYERNEMKVRDYKEMCYEDTAIFRYRIHTGCLLFTLNNTHTLSKHSIYPETRSASEMHFLFKCTLYSADKKDTDRD
jgi:hypothetical protein